MTRCGISFETTKAALNMAGKRKPPPDRGTAGIVVDRDADNDGAEEVDSHHNLIPIETIFHGSRRLHHRRQNRRRHAQWPLLAKAGLTVTAARKITRKQIANTKDANTCDRHQCEL